MFVLRHCAFVSQLTEGPIADRGDVVVEDGKIAAILPWGQAPAEAEGLDLQGATLMPGMIDMHVHLLMAATPYELMMRKPLERVFDCYRYAKTLLDYGYTTVRDCGDALDGPTVALGRAIDGGLLEGPRIIPSCGTLCPREPGVEVLEYIVDYTNGPMEVRRKVREHFQQGAQFIKLYGSGSMMAVGSEPGLRIMEADEIAEASRMAARKNSYVAIHAHGAEAIDVAVRNGVRTVEHASLIADETVQYIKGQPATIGIVPTLSVFFRTVNQADEGDGSAYFAQRAKKLAPTVCSCLSNAYDNGIPIGWGTDVSMLEFLEDPFAEFRLRKEKLGWSNEAIVRQATCGSALLLDRADQLGSLQEGKAADLIVVAKNPVEDLTALYSKPLHVIKGGRLIR